MLVLFVPPLCVTAFGITTIKTYISEGACIDENNSFTCAGKGNFIDLDDMHVYGFFNWYMERL